MDEKDIGPDTLKVIHETARERSLAVEKSLRDPHKFIPGMERQKLLRIIPLLRESARVQFEAGAKWMYRSIVETLVGQVDSPDQKLADQARKANDTKGE